MPLTNPYSAEAVSTVPFTEPLVQVYYENARPLEAQRLERQSLLKDTK